MASKSQSVFALYKMKRKGQGHFAHEKGFSGSYYKRNKLLVWQYHVMVFQCNIPWRSWSPFQPHLRCHTMEMRDGTIRTQRGTIGKGWFFYLLVGASCPTVSVKTWLWIIALIPIGSQINLKVIRLGIYPLHSYLLANLTKLPEINSGVECPRSLVHYCVV